MNEEKLQEMSGQKLMTHIDQLFEWIKRQAGEGPIESRTLKDLQEEVRRRIMERDTGDTHSPKPPDPVRLSIKPEAFYSQTTGVGLILYQAVISRGGSGVQVMHGLNQREANLLLSEAISLASFGVPFVELPSPLCNW